MEIKKGHKYYFGGVPPQYESRYPKDHYIVVDEVNYSGLHGLVYTKDGRPTTKHLMINHDSAMRGWLTYHPDNNRFIVEDKIKGWVN
jgi:hypothetical protein